MSAETLHPPHPAGPTPPRRPGRPEPQEERARPQRALVALGLLPMLALLAFMLGLAFGVRGTDVWMLGLALLTALIGFVPLALDQGRAPSRRHLLISMFAIAFLLVHVAPAFITYLPGDEPKVPTGMKWALLYPQDVVQGQTVILGGLLALLVGYALPLGRFGAALLPAPRHEWSVEETLFAAALLGGVGWLVYMLSQFHMLPAFLGTGVLGYIARGYMISIGLLTLAWLRLGSRLAFLLVAVLVPITMGFNFFTGSKRAFLSVGAMVGLAWILHRGRIQARWVAAGCLALVLYFPVSQFYRDVILQDYTLGAVDVLSDPLGVLSRVSSFMGSWDAEAYLSEGLEASGNRLDGLGRASLIIRETPASVPFQGGWTLANIFIAYIPRVLWPEKPIITIGKWVTDTYGGGADIQSSTGPTWIGEFYLNFGMPGVLVGMALLGVLLRIVHELFLVRSRTILGLFLSMQVLYILLTEMDGGVVGLVNGITFGAGPVLVVHALIRTFHGSRGRPVPGGVAHPGTRAAEASQT